MTDKESLEVTEVVTGLPNMTVKEYLELLSDDERKAALFFLDRGEKRGLNVVCNLVEFEP